MVNVRRGQRLSHIVSYKRCRWHSTFLFAILLFWEISRRHLWGSSHVHSQSGIQNCPDGRCRFNNFSEISRISKFPRSGKSSVAGPERSAVGLRWFKYSNICVNHKDHFKYNSKDNHTFRENLRQLNLAKVTKPYRSSALEVDINGIGYALKGKSVIVQCWRCPRRNPSHFMFAYGKLFALLHDELHSIPLDNVIFFQCPDPFTGSVENDFFRFVWKIVHSAGIRSGWFTTSTRFFTTPALKLEPWLCMDEVLIDHSVGRVLGANEDITIAAWRNALRTAIPGRLLQPAGHKDFCIDKLKIAVYQRSEGSALRSFFNLDEVVALAHEWSDDVRVISLRSNSSIYTAADVMNSFHLLITPHGSHLTNGLFILSDLFLPAIVEVVATCYNTDWSTNNEKFTTYYEMSTGHQTMDLSLQQKLSACERRESCSWSEACPRALGLRAIQSDLAVDIPRLRSALIRAHGALNTCAPSSS